MAHTQLLTKLREAGQYAAQCKYHGSLELLQRAIHMLEPMDITERMVFLSTFPGTDDPYKEDKQFYRACEEALALAVDMKHLPLLRLIQRAMKETSITQVSFNDESEQQQAQRVEVVKKLEELNGRPNVSADDIKSRLKGENQKRLYENHLVKI